MQARHMIRLRGRRPFVAALATLASCGSWAQEHTPYYVGGTQGLTHDSNVYRISPSIPDPNGLPRGDTYSSTGLVGGFDQPYHRQRFFGTGTVQYNHYFDHSRLNNTSYGVNAGWDWATLYKLSGNFNVSANQSLASFNGDQTIQTTNRNILRTDQVSGSVLWGGAGRLGLVSNYAHSRVHYSAPEYQNSNSSGDTGSIGVTYNVNPDITTGIAFRLTRSDSPNGIQTEPNTFSPNTGTGRNIDLTLDYRYTVQTAFNARLSFTNQSNSDAPGQDFSGVTGSLSGTYAPTGKLAFNLSYNRDAGTNGVFFNTIGTTPAGGIIAPVGGLYANSQITNSVTLGTTYAATAKISATANVSYSRAKIANANGNTGIMNAAGNNYNDTFRSQSLGVQYAAHRALNLGCNLSHEIRSVTSLTNGDYSANVVGCVATLTFR